METGLNSPLPIQDLWLTRSVRRTLGNTTKTRAIEVGGKDEHSGSDKMRLRLGELREHAHTHTKYPSTLSQRSSGVHNDTHFLLQ